MHGWECGVPMCHIAGFVPNQMLLHWHKIETHFTLLGGQLSLPAWMHIEQTNTIILSQGYVLTCVEMNNSVVSKLIFKVSHT